MSMTNASTTFGVDTQNIPSSLTDAMVSHSSHEGVT
jgi:hypothetical protein